MHFFVFISDALLKDDSPINSETVLPDAVTPLISLSNSETVLPDTVTPLISLPNADSLGQKKLKQYLGQPTGDTSELSNLIFQNTETTILSTQPLQSNLIQTHTPSPKLHVELSVTNAQRSYGNTHLPTSTPQNPRTQVSPKKYSITEPSFVDAQTPSLCLLPADPPTQTL